MTPPRIVEHWDDGHSAFGCTYVFEVKECSVDFQVHEIQGTHLDGSSPFYDMYNWQCSGDWVSDLDSACPQIYGTVKWDGCSHVWFGNAVEKGGNPDGYLHLCGKPSWLWLQKALGRVWDRCWEMMPHRLEEEP